MLSVVLAGVVDESIDELARLLEEVLGDTDRHKGRCRNHRLASSYCCTPETLYHRDDALLYIAYVMLIWAAPIPADRWHCSLWP